MCIDKMYSEAQQEYIAYASSLLKIVGCAVTVPKLTNEL